MAAPYNPPKKNEDFKIPIQLRDVANPNRVKVNPTIASGDFKITKDGGALANLTNLPTVSPAGSSWVVIELTSTEMNADIIGLQAIDQTEPPEWADWGIGIPTTQ